MKILFVCMGNICRSPTVEAVARVEFARAGLDIEVDSAGTENYHIGRQADPRAIALAEANGYPMSAHRARQVCSDDFSRFDQLLVMDNTNLRAVLAKTPESARDRVALFLPFVGISEPVELPDPYYGSAGDFQHALDLARDGIMALVGRIGAQGHPRTDR
ncbi:MAG TPA: low molecular weight protein-tyrosine-phosphatase [Dokdonella sp.]|uniref:low molecular weight protein-tyrosine-phosphatase n=1 Tax=Dokdonella sp. TaxID=2291710 RepID=UPI002D7E403C|nr:low molecular weight protein-tyrosine-phosphatase [Dokdonella sp.]HET9031352.1 low molecular weight protein-tyrosine-phosphatase [Dokdonella sp.]